jgi:hypothetical protein
MTSTAAAAQGLRRCADCSGPVGYFDHEAPVAARRCASCSRRRSNTNILTFSLLLAALLSYLWYNKLASTTAFFQEQIAGAFADLAQPPAAAAPPPAASPAPAMQAAPPGLTRPHHAAARPARRRAPSRPVHDTDGLY